MDQGCGGQSHPRNSLLASPQCCLPPVKSQAGTEMAETVTFFKTDLSDCRWLGFDHVSHSQAFVLLLSLISATNAGLLGAGHLILMMMVAMMKTIMKRTTMKIMS